MTPEEAQAIGQANQMVENNLSSVEITHTTKGDTWKVKVYNEDPHKALIVAQLIDTELRDKYGK